MHKLIHFPFPSTIICFILLLNIGIIQNLEAQWVQSSGINGGKVKAIISKGQNLFAATDTAGVFISGDNGSNWSKSNSGLDNHNVNSLCVKNNTLIAGIGNGLSTGAIYVSNDNASTWASSTVKYYGFLFCLALYKTDVLAGTWYGVTKSTDAGNTWTTLPDNGLPSNASVSALACNTTTIYAGVSGSSTGGTGVFSSSDNGTNWSAKNTGLTNTIIHSLAINSSNLFAGTSGGGVFVSSDNGTTWNAANTGLINMNINTLVIRGSKLFAGTDDGIYMSADNGTSWTGINTGLPASTKITSIFFNDPYVLIGSSVTVWRQPISNITGIAPEQNMNSNIAIFPNPGSGEIRIQGEAEGRYFIFDQLGRIIQTFELNEINNFGFTISGLSKGLYYVVADDKHQVIRQKLVVLK